MQKDYKRMEYNEFLQYINKLCDHLEKYIQDNKIRIDYICPVLRSGAVPAIYITYTLNIVKLLPVQVKHIAYQNGENKIEMIFNPFDSIQIEKKEPVFLVVEAMHSTGTSVEICINEIKNRFNLEWSKLNKKKWLPLIVIKGKQNITIVAIRYTK